jgi:hypothetical protein
LEVSALICQRGFYFGFSADNRIGLTKKRFGYGA